MAGERDVRLWESEWRAIRVAVEARLATFEAQTLPCQRPSLLQVDTREASLEAPAGTPSPLREAFDAVAAALFEAAEMRRCPPTARLMFNDQAHALADASGAGRERYAAAELHFQAATDEAGRCALQEALNTVCRVNDAVGHVMLGRVPFHHATAHIQNVPAFNLAEMLGAMRRQTARAALALQARSHQPTHPAAPQRGPMADLPPSARGSQDEQQQPRPNGVEGGCWLWWEGKRHDIPMGVVYRLIAFMWGRDSAPYGDLDGDVFEGAVLPATVRARTSEVNRVLKKIGVPWRLQADATSRILTKQPAN
jgi:hypothetical protein